MKLVFKTIFIFTLTSSAFAQSANDFIKGTEEQKAKELAKIQEYSNDKIEELKSDSPTNKSAQVAIQKLPERLESMVNKAIEYKRISYFVSSKIVSEVADEIARTVEAKKAGITGADLRKWASSDEHTGDKAKDAAIKALVENEKVMTPLLGDKADEISARVQRAIQDDLQKLSPEQRASVEGKIIALQKNFKNPIEAYQAMSSQVSQIEQAWLYTLHDEKFEEIAKGGSGAISKAFVKNFNDGKELPKVQKKEKKKIERSALDNTVDPIIKAALGNVDAGAALTDDDPEISKSGSGNAVAGIIGGGLPQVPSATGSTTSTRSGDFEDLQH